MATNYGDVNAVMRRATQLIDEGDFVEAHRYAEAAQIFYLTHQCNSPETARINAVVAELKKLAGFVEQYGESG